ncbi:MAG: FxsB family radical SAM/SPASM domain protein [Bacteroidetes bacterium]|nr:FxsB family radical SAM/SPASM domain protein [Bacteroidota bacterium]
MENIAWSKFEGGEFIERTQYPLNTFLIKIVSLCNLNCSYCYMYNLADKTYKSQPKFFAVATAKQLAYRINEHVNQHKLEKITIVFHGGEPLLINIIDFQDILNLFNNLVNIEIKYGLQTNGTLINESWLNFFSYNKISIGISLDGFKEINDKNRIYHSGKGSYDDVVKAIELLNNHNENFEKVKFSILCVIDLSANPDALYDLLSKFNPNALDFLFPLAHFDNPPPNKESLHSSEYGEWLIEIFKKWYNSKSKIRIRFFHDIISLLLGGRFSVESLGLSHVDLVVIETNGDIEAVDALKATFEGASKLNLNVFNNSFDETLRHPAIYSRQLGKNELCTICQNCPIVNICGGGYLPSRYSKVNYFDNPSIYCYDLIKLITFIREYIANDIKKLSTR